MHNDNLLSSIPMQAVEQRHSVRSYADTPISEEQQALLTDVISQCNARANLHMQLIVNEPLAFGKSRLAHYGKFSGVSNYICLIGPKADDTEELLGYYGELIVLKAQQMGLNTCWVGLTYSKKRVACPIAEGHKLYAVIAIGHGATEGIGHKVKSAQQVATPWASAPEWFKHGVQCALLAPTALNQQKFHFQYISDDMVRATTSWGFYCKMDLGIAKLHFELGAMGHSVTWA